MNVGVSLSEPDTLCSTVSGELDNCSFIMQLRRKDGKPYMLIFISCESEWEKKKQQLPATADGGEEEEKEKEEEEGGLTSWSCLTSSAGVPTHTHAHSHYDMLMTFFGSGRAFCFHFGICDSCGSVDATKRKRADVFFLLWKWGSVFIKTQKMARRSRRPWARIWVKWEGKERMQQQHDFFPLSPPWQDDTKGGEAVEVDETQHQWRRSGQVLSRS